MKTLSLKLDDAIFDETERILRGLKKPRNRYINDALNFFNKYQQRKLLQEKLQRESALVREESMTVLQEFEAIDGENSSV